MTRKSSGSNKRQKSGLNRSLLDVGIGNLKDLIKYKVTEAGGFYIEVPTTKVKPSQTCPNCGHQKNKTPQSPIPSTLCGEAGFLHRFLQHCSIAVQCGTDDFLHYQLNLKRGVNPR